MSDKNVLTIIGTSSSGKTYLALKIAKELELHDKEVCIVSFDTLSPLVTLKENYENYNISIGYLLTKDTDTTQRDILTSMIPLTNNISLISYIYGDTKDKYPKILSNRVREFIELLKGIVDNIIIDAGSNIVEPEARTSCQIADKIINILEPNYKSVAYYKTYTQLLDRIDIDNNSIINIVNKIFYDSNYKKYCDEMGLRFYKELPYLKEINKFYNEPFKKLNKNIHETEKYNRNFNDIIRTLYKFEYENNNIINEENIHIKEKVENIKEDEYFNNNDKKLSDLRQMLNNRNKISDENSIVNEKKKRGLFGFLKKKDGEGE